MYFFISRASGLCCVCLAINGERDTLYEVGSLGLKTPPLLTILLQDFDWNATSNPQRETQTCAAMPRSPLPRIPSPDALRGNKDRDFDMQISLIIKL